jgi:hypothetical protein
LATASSMRCQETGCRRERSIGLGRTLASAAATTTHLYGYCGSCAWP